MNKMPREKIIEDGSSSLSDDELLAIMLSSGTKDENVFDMSKRLIKDYGFSNLMRMNYSELSKISGIKTAKASKLLAVFEIARRVMKEESEAKTLQDAKSLFEYVYPMYYGLTKEVMTLILVDSKLKIIGQKKYSNDSYNEIKVPLKEIMKDIITMDAFGIFLIHNHPAGTLEPSLADIQYTMSLGNTLSSIDILLLDHLIIANDKYYSFSDNDTLKSYSC